MQPAAHELPAHSARDLRLTLSAMPEGKKRLFGIVLAGDGSPLPAALVAVGGKSVRSADDGRFAAPWAHWRILRHRAAGLPEEYDPGQLYFEPSDVVLAPTHDRDKGFRHLAWVDLDQRLGGRVWPGLSIALVLIGLGVAQISRGLDPTRP